MSDPVTNTEIEDVLSSIRRLVSENRPLPDAEAEDSVATSTFDTASAQEDDTADDESPLTLVLTPALRVEDQEVDEVPSNDADTSFSDEDEIAFDDEEEPLSDDRDVSSDEIQDFDEKLVEAHEPDVTTLDVADTSEDFFDENQGLEEGLDATEDDLGLVDDKSDKAGAELAEDGDQGSIEAIELANAAEDVEPEEAMDEEQPFDFKQVLEARIHQFKDASTVDDVTVEYSSDEKADMTDAVMDELRVRMPEDVADAMHMEAAADLSAAMEETAELDEAMLREMVSDIVRQELQGALGERITRNVRKLVRREIHRALAAHDLG